MAVFPKWRNVRTWTSSSAEGVGGSTYLRQAIGLRRLMTAPGAAGGEAEEPATERGIWTPGGGGGLKAPPFGGGP